MSIYGQTTARHYAAFRPPLHRLIVDEALAGQIFENAIDVGCGTGWSSLALTRHCSHVAAVDASADMLAAAAAHPRISYSLGDGAELPVESRTIDLVSVAGALPYLAIDRFVRELQRVCRPDAVILPYDFQVELQPLLACFPFLPARNNAGYDHAANLSSAPDVRTLRQEARSVSFQASAEAAAHILLSSISRVTAVAAHFRDPDPFEKVVATLQDAQWRGELAAEIWYAVHQLSPDEHRPRRA